MDYQRGRENINASSDAVAGGTEKIEKELRDYASGPSHVASVVESSPLSSV
jgi:hypothetical protein